MVNHAAYDAIIEIPRKAYRYLWSFIKRINLVDINMSWIQIPHATDYAARAVISCHAKLMTHDLLQNLFDMIRKSQQFRHDWCHPVMYDQFCVCNRYVASCVQIMLFLMITHRMWYIVLYSQKCGLLKKNCSIWWGNHSGLTRLVWLLFVLTRFVPSCHVWSIFV